MIKINSKFNIINSDVLRLELICFNKGNEKEIPYYWYNIIENKTNKLVGKISIRIGSNYHSYYNGNIGYEIDSDYRGNNYAYLASRMVLEVAKFYKMNELILTCEENNIASSKTIEKLGGVLIETVIPPRDYFAYFEGIKKHKIYKLDI